MCEAGAFYWKSQQNNIDDDDDVVSGVKKQTARIKVLQKQQILLFRFECRLSYC